MTEPAQRDHDTSRWKRLFRRKFYLYPFLNRKLQFSFAALLAVIGLGNAIYLLLLFYFYARETFDLLVPYIPEYIAVDPIFAHHTRIFLRTVGFILIPETVLLVLWGLFFAHRIAGPLYKIDRTFREISGGKEPKPIHLRDGDMLLDVADQANLAIAGLSGQRKEIATALAELEAGDAKSAGTRLKKLIRPE
ncbi:MAG: hypothetical protein V1495_10265 [Pseudomonadota bacterium]